MGTFSDITSTWIGKTVNVTQLAGKPIEGKLLAINNAHLNVILQIDDIPFVVRGSNIISIVLGRIKK